MRHIRIDNEHENSKARFTCGIGWPLPDGDSYINESEIFLLHTVDCRGCLPTPVTLGTPISELSGRSGEPGYEEFCRIARSWGYD
jgi:hypothetical protein